MRQDQEAVEVRRGPASTPWPRARSSPSCRSSSARREVAAHGQEAAAEAEHRGEPGRVAAPHGLVVGPLVARDRLVEQPGGDEREARVVQGRHGGDVELPRLERAARQLDRALAVAREAQLLHRRGREHEVAAVAAVQGREVERLHELVRVRVRLGLPRAGEHDLVREPLVEVGALDRVDAGAHALAQRQRVAEAVLQPERARGLHADLAAAHRVGDQLDRLLEMLGRRAPVDAALGEAELGQQLAAQLVVAPLLERAREIGDRGLGRAARERALRGGAERVDHERVGAAVDEHQVRRGLLGRHAGLEPQLGGAAVAVAARDRVEVLVDRAAHDRVEELDRVVADEQVGAQQHARRVRGGRVVEAREHAGLAQLGAVAEDRRGLDQRDRRPRAGARAAARRPGRRPAARARAAGAPGRRAAAASRARRCRAARA